ncbi:uncharacterized protein [Antedon mediterranea]|uniref:uncharacterized protein n=1 Tax=Antedon mediterranea TaxID=105859 RepID=UPI003AF4CA0A
MQSPLKLEEVRHEQRRVAALMQNATALRYHSIQPKSAYYNHIKYNYLTNRPWRSLASNNTEDVATESQNISLPDINGIKHLYAKYTGKQYVPLTQRNGDGNNANAFPVIHCIGGADVDKKSLSQKVSRRLLSNNLGNFLPKIHNVDEETWQLYNSRGLTNVKIRSLKGFTLMSPSSQSTSTGLQRKPSTDTVYDHSRPTLKNRNNSWKTNVSGPLKVSAIHDELNKFDEKRKKLKTNLRYSDKNMYKSTHGEGNGSQHSVKLPKISTETNKKGNSTTFRYTHRQSEYNLPVTDDLKDIIGSKTDTEIPHNVDLASCSKGNHARNNSSQNSRPKLLVSTPVEKSTANDETSSTELFTDKEALKINEYEDKGTHQEEQTRTEHFDDTDMQSNSESDHTDETEDSDESEMDSEINDVKGSTLKDASEDTWRDAYVNALAVARSRRQTDTSFMGSQISRSFAFSYFDHVPYCKCKKCTEKTMRNRGRAKKNGSIMKSIFGDVNMYDYYKS